MDASMVMSKPAPQPTTPSGSQASDAHDSQDDFAQHLPANDAPRAPDRPATRRGETREANATSEESATTEAEEKTTDNTPTDVTLTAPIAPAVVRPQNSVVTIDLSAFIAQGAPQAATPAAPTVAPTTGKQPAAPQAPAANGAETAAPPQGAQTTDAAADMSQQATLTPATKPTAALETIALPAMPSAPTETRALPRLRAGRSEGGDAQTADARPTTTAATPTTNAQPTAATGVQTANAVQAVAATTPTQEKTATVDAAPVGEAMPAEHRARAVNEATATHAGHRATTPAALVAQHVIRRFEGRSTSIDVRLDPPELGRVQVSLEVGADNKVTAVVAAENPATLSDLVRSARELERALQDAGLELDAGGLSFDLAERGENASSDNAASGKSSGRGESGGEALTQTPVSRPFGLESWRGARVDVMA